MSYNAIGLAFSFIVAFVLGLVLGVLGCVAAIKFVQWMKGKSLIFTPCPRVHTNVGNYGPIVNNPTYELDNGRKHSESTTNITTQPARAHKYSSSILAMLEGGASTGDHSSQSANSGCGAIVYEAMEEPINEEELDLEAHRSHTLPYAVHAYPDDRQLKDASKPVVYKKSNSNNFKAGKKDDQAKSGSGSGEHAKKFANKKPPIPYKPTMVKSPDHGAMEQLESDPGCTYSELDKKSSYAILEPHIGDSIVVTKGDAIENSYGRLNH